MRLHTFLSLSLGSSQKPPYVNNSSKWQRNVSKYLYSTTYIQTPRIYLCTVHFLWRLPSVFCLSIHLPFSNLAADVTPLKLSSRQKAWETDQLVSDGTEQVLPLTEPTQTNADPGESREKGAQNGIRERDFSLFCLLFYPHFSKHLFSYFISLCFPLPPLVSFFFFWSQYIKSNIPVWKKISVRRKLYKCVCLYSRQAAAATSVWFWQQVSVLL